MCDAGMLWFGSRDIAAIRGISEEMPWPAAMKAHEKLQFEIVQRKELHLPQYVTVCVLIPGPEFLRGGDATKKFWDLNLLIYLAFMISLLGLSEILEDFELCQNKLRYRQSTTHIERGLAKPAQSTLSPPSRRAIFIIPTINILSPNTIPPDSGNTTRDPTSTNNAHTQKNKTSNKTF
tara:strand:- start:26 stop:559 length:534 start_codon:yes stop_codon:yes gene_type:complete